MDIIYIFPYRLCANVTHWYTIGFIFEEGKQLLRVMGIQEDLMGIGVLSIGYEAEGGSHAPRKPDYFRVPTGNETGKTASLSSLGGIIMLNLAYC